jgi:hypothetical protein
MTKLKIEARLASRRITFQGGFEMAQRILCPTDLTTNTRDSVAYSMTLAQRNGAQLIVFHTTSFPSFNHYPCEFELYLQLELVSKFKVDHLLK